MAYILIRSSCLRGDRDGFRVNTSSITSTSVNKVAWFVAVLVGLTALSSILASIFGAQAIILAVVSTIFTGVAVFWASKLQVRENRNRTARELARRQARELERQREEELERQRTMRRRLDRDCSELLRRAEVAVENILKSEARAEDLLDPPVDESLIRDGVQRILSAGAKITDLRAKQISITVRSLPKYEQIDYERFEELKPGPMTDAVLERQRQALAMVMNWMTSQVENLEHYASSVKKVDATYRDWIGSQEAERLNDPVRDVLAEMAKDKLAAEEYSRLTERTSMAEQAFRQSIEEANLVGEILALPDDKDGEGLV